MPLNVLNLLNRMLILLLPLVVRCRLLVLLVNRLLYWRRLLLPLMLVFLQVILLLLGKCCVIFVSSRVRVVGFFSPNPARVALFAHCSKSFSVLNVLFVDYKPYFLVVLWFIDTGVKINLIFIQYLIGTKCNGVIFGSECDVLYFAGVSFIAVLASWLRCPLFFRL